MQVVLSNPKSSHLGSAFVGGLIGLAIGAFLTLNLEIFVDWVVPADKMHSAPVAAPEASIVPRLEHSPFNWRGDYNPVTDYQPDV